MSCIANFGKEIKQKQIPAYFNYFQSFFQSLGILYIFENGCFRIPTKFIFNGCFFVYESFIF